MRFVLMTEPQLGGTYDDLLFAAQSAEAAGLDGFSRSDHYYSGRPGLPTTDAFTTVAGLARETHKARLCVLVSPITFRHPAVIAKSAGSIDEMSNGRFDLGVGTGWMSAEHQVFGLPFPSQKERFERLEEVLQYLNASFRGTTFEGRHYRINADVRPRPRGLSLIVGGTGRQTTPDLAGRFADEYNQSVAVPDQLAANIERMRDSAVAAGRDPASIIVSVMGPSILAANKTRFSDIIQQAAALRGNTVAELEGRWLRAWVPGGPPAKATYAFAALAAVGVTKYYLQWFDLSDRAGISEQLELVAELSV